MVFVLIFEAIPGIIVNKLIKLCIIMTPNFENHHQLEEKKEAKKENSRNLEARETPWHLRALGAGVIEMFCKKFSVDGIENIKDAKENNPDGKFIITAAHLNNLDVPAMLKVLGSYFDMQITGESVLLEKMKYFAHKLAISSMLGEGFTPLDYKENKVSKHGSFNPDNFVGLLKKIEGGKTPWIAISPMSLNGKMRRPGVGAIYAAALSGSAIIPTALDVKSSGSVSLEGIKEQAKGLIKRAEAVYRIGRPFGLPDMDVGIIEEVMAKRKKGEVLTADEKSKFGVVVRQLREQADLLAGRVAELLPEEKRFVGRKETPEVMPTAKAT